MTGFDLSAFDLSALVERLAGPVGLKLSLALVHFLWQGVLIAAGAALLMRVLGRRSARRRYAIGVAGMGLMALAPVVTFCLVTPPPPVPIDLGVMDAAALDAELLESLIAEIGETSKPAAAPPAPPLTWPERLRLWQPYLLLVWLAGTGVFGLRLGVGAQASWRFGRGKKPLPEAWLRIAAEVAGRVGLKAPRVYLSDRVAEAVAVGLLRPMVLLPVAWLGRVPPDVLEAVLAHELAHLRRHDLWINLLQRCVEAALFYHPAVWWLSRRVRVEREYCCDEAAATAVSGRAAYARALEFVATEAVSARRVAPKRPAVFGSALAAGMGGDSMALLDRVRRVLGAEEKPPRSRMSEGLLALAVPAALWAGVVTIGPAFAQADAPKDDAAASADEESRGEDAKEDSSASDDARSDEGRSEDVLIERVEKVPFLGDLPLVGRLFTTNGIAVADADSDGRADLYLAERGPDGADAGGDEVGQALRELREELKALREEVQELRAGASRNDAQKALDQAVKARDNALSHWHAAQRAVEEGRSGDDTDAKNQYFEARARFEKARERLRAETAGKRDAPDPELKGGALRPDLKGSRHQVIEGDPPRVVTYGVDETGKLWTTKSEPLPERVRKGPIRYDGLRIESRHDDGKGAVRYYLDQADPRHPARYEVRIFKKGEPGPDHYIKRLHVEQEDGKPRVFLDKEGKDGTPEKVEARLEGNEALIDLEDGRIHVRALDGTAGIKLDSSGSQAADVLDLRVYPVADLITPTPAPSEKEGSRSNPTWQVGFDKLIDLVTQTVQPSSWERAGGKGVIRPQDTTMSLVIRQSAPIHDQIAALLDTLRQLQDARPDESAVEHVIANRNRSGGPEGEQSDKPDAQKSPAPPLPPASPGAENIVPSRTSRVVTLNIGGKKVPVVVEEVRESEKGPAKEISVRVLEAAPKGVEVLPHPRPKDGDVRDKVIRDLEERVKELQKQLDERHPKTGAAGDSPEEAKSVETRVFRLKYASAETIAEHIRQAYSDPESLSGAAAIADRRSNSVTISARPELMEQITARIRDMDAPAAAQQETQRRRALIDRKAEELELAIKRLAAQPGGQEEQMQAIREKLEAVRTAAEAVSREAEAERRDIKAVRLRYEEEISRAKAEAERAHVEAAAAKARADEQAARVAEEAERAAADVAAEAARREAEQAKKEAMAREQAAGEKRAPDDEDASAKEKSYDQGEAPDEEDGPDSTEDDAPESEKAAVRAIDWPPGAGQTFALHVGTTR